MLGERGAELSVPRWNLGAIPKVLQHVADEEADDTFNLGFGWVAIVAPEDEAAALAAGAGGKVLGRVVDNKGVRVTISDL